MARLLWKSVGPGVEAMIDGVSYKAAPVPAGLDGTRKYIAWKRDRILGTARLLRGAQVLCERAATRNINRKRKKTLE